VKSRLEGDFGDVWVEGQVTNYRGLNASGHRYFGLKDEGAMLSAVLFKFSAARALAFELEEGQQVLAHGRLSVYEPRGNYQLMCDRIELKGLGALQQRFEQLKRQLEAEGLFAEGRKRPLPAFPRRVAVISSPTGAVIRDILTVTARRCPWVDLVLLPVRVQGEGAKEDIAAALKAAGAGAAGPLDLVLLARGGGSLEDLWAFNEELVARAIAACPLPVLSAVGHEVDYTIADFVADRRAPTPSAAAEVMSPGGEELGQRLGSLLQALRAETGAVAAAAAQRLEALQHRLERASPRFRLEQGAQRLDELKARLEAAARRCVQDAREALAQAAGRMQSLSPLAILARGYAAAFDGQGRLLRQAKDAAPGQALRVLLGEGELDATITAIHLERRHG
jgi:exodeoxyribonuclease VII large subunit